MSRFVGELSQYANVVGAMRASASGSKTSPDMSAPKGPSCQLGTTDRVAACGERAARHVEGVQPTTMPAKSWNWVARRMIAGTGPSWTSSQVDSS